MLVYRSLLKQWTVHDRDYCTTKRKCERWKMKRSQILQSTWWRGQEWRSTERQRRFYCRSYNKNDSQGVQEASYDNSVDCCYAMPVYNPVLQLLQEERRLQVDELVHQQQGAGQAGQVGFRATTVTARVASWNWPKTQEEGKGTSWIQATREKKRSRRSCTAVEERGRDAEDKRQKKEKETAEFTHSNLLLFKQCLTEGTNGIKMVQIPDPVVIKLNNPSFFRIL